MCGGHVLWTEKVPYHHPISLKAGFISCKFALPILRSQLSLANMAALTISSAAAVPSSINKQLCSSNTGSFAPLGLKKHGRVHGGSRKETAKVVCQAANIAAGRAPDMGKRKLMNLLLLGAISLPTAGMLGPYALLFVPPESGGGGGGLVAKDALGNDITASAWLKTHPYGDRTLAQGLKGDPTYIVVENDGQLATYGINAVCTHLGCVVPWNKAENKFICPCHGSQYNYQGKVVRGPAPLSLAITHVDVVDDKIVFVPWVETDFRTGENPWWS